MFALRVLSPLIFSTVICIICRYLFFLLIALIFLDYHSIFVRGTDQFQPSMPHMAEEFQVSKSSAFGLQKKKTLQVPLQLMTGLDISSVHVPEHVVICVSMSSLITVYLFKRATRNERIATLWSLICFCNLVIHPVRAFPHQLSLDWEDKQHLYPEFVYFPYDV